MVTLAFDEQHISVPQSWGDIKLRDYEKWFSAEPRNRIEQVQLVADICGIDSEILLDNPTQFFDTVYDIVRFVFDNYECLPSHTLECDGQIYVISGTEDLTLAEWVDIENVFDLDSPSRLSDVLSILCRPLGEVYDTKVCDTRKEIFKNLTMDKAMPLLAFFLQKRKQFQTVSNLYSEVGLQQSRCLRLIRDFAGNGDGTKLLPIWQRIKYYFLMRFLKKQLSRFSDFFSTGSTKFRQKTS